MLRQRISKRLLLALMLGSASLIANMTCAQAESTYAPPPLFGAAPAKIVVAPAVSAPPPIAAALDNAESLKDAASVSERVANPVQVQAPINTELLLDHPADRIEEKAITAMKAPQVVKAKTIPDFARYTVPQSTPLSKKNAKVLPTAKPAMPIIAKTMQTAPVAKPVIVNHETAPTTKALVFSRDPKTKEFKRTESTEKFAKVTPKREMITQKIDTTDLALKPLASKKNMPAVPPLRVDAAALRNINPDKLANIERAMKDVGKNHDHAALEANITPLSDEMSNELLALSDTSFKKNSAPPLPNILDVQKQIAPLGDQHVLLLFKPGLTDMTDKLKGAVDENILPRLSKNPSLRVEIRAYASASEDGISSDRRVSLARGLAVREYLRTKGVETARMDVRALGQNTDRKPVDRVDVVILQSGEP